MPRPQRSVARPTTRPAPAAGIRPAATTSLLSGPALRLEDSLWFRFLHVRNQLRLLALTCLIIYFNTLGNEYAVDDGMVIVGNKFTTQGFKGIKDILTKDSFLGSMDQNVLPGGRYRPLSILTFAIEWEFFGDTANKKGNPFVSHLVNVLLYIACVLVVFWVLRRYLLRQYPDVAFGAALLFAVHPVHIEAVGNLKGRDEVMALLFMFLCVWFIFDYLEKGSKNSLVLVSALVFYFLALLSKENPVTFVVILPLMLYYFSDLNKNKILYIGLVLLVVTVFYVVLRIGIAGLNVKTLVDDVFQQPYLLATAIQKYCTIILVLGYYLKLLVWPHPLSFDYSYEQIPYVGPTDPGFLLSLVLHIGLLAYALYTFKQKSIFSFSILYYMISISIVSNIVFNLGGVMGERFLFQASLGFTIAVAYALHLLADRLSVKYGKWLIVGFLLAVSTVASARVIVRNRDWQSNETLYTRDVNNVPNSSKANKCAAEIYLRWGINAKDSLQKRENLEKAVYYLERAVAIYPDFIQAYLDLGAAQHFLGRHDRAEQAWKKAEAINPHNEFTGFYFADLLAPQIIADAFEDYKAKRFESAFIKFQKAVQYRPNDHFSWYHLGHLYGLRGEMPEAVSSFEKAVALNDTLADYWYNLGGAYFTVGDFQKALIAWQRAEKIQPDYPQLQAGMQAARFKLGLNPYGK